MSSSQLAALHLNGHKTLRNYAPAAASSSTSPSSKWHIIKLVADEDEDAAAMDDANETAFM